MSTWNDIPFDSEAEPEVKALEFDLQIAENGGSSQPQAEGNWNPYGEDRRNG